MVTCQTDSDMRIVEALGVERGARQPLYFAQVVAALESAKVVLANIKLSCYSNSKILS